MQRRGKKQAEQRFAIASSPRPSASNRLHPGRSHLDALHDVVQGADARVDLCRGRVPRRGSLLVGVVCINQSQSRSLLLRRHFLARQAGDLGRGVASGSKRTCPSRWRGGGAHRDEERELRAHGRAEEKERERVWKGKTDVSLRAFDHSLFLSILLLSSSSRARDDGRRGRPEPTKPPRGLLTQVQEHAPAGERRRARWQARSDALARRRHRFGLLAPAGHPG